MNADGCSSNCLIEIASFCGDGIIDPLESCDDGNTNDFDGCSSGCLIEPPIGDPIEDPLLSSLSSEERLTFQTQ